MNKRKAICLAISLLIFTSSTTYPLSTIDIKKSVAYQNIKNFFSKPHLVKSKNNKKLLVYIGATTLLISIFLISTIAWLKYENEYDFDPSSNENQDNEYKQKKEKTDSQVKKIIASLKKTHSKIVKLNKKNLEPKKHKEKRKKIIEEHKKKWRSFFGNSTNFDENNITSEEKEKLKQLLLQL